MSHPLSYATPAVRIGRYRWVICALLFFSTTINYVDRQVLSVLAPTLQTKIGWSDTQYGDINAAFSAAYAIGLLGAGWIIDRIGVRLGYAAALTLWSLASAAHALARSVLGFGCARFALGLAEAGNFPAAIKTVAEWFPQRERSLATGIFNSGCNIGALIAPLVVPVIALRWGWQSAFIATAAVGMVWVFFWLPIYRKPRHHPRVSSAELALIESDAPEPITPLPWIRLLEFRETWAFAAAKFLTDPIWWFYLFWSAKFFNDKFHIDLKTIGPPLVVIYLLSDAGSILGGWCSTALIRRGWSVNTARKSALLICALAVLPVIFATSVSNPWASVLLIGLAAAGHQGFSANLFTTASDLFPRRAVGSVVGIGGMAGAIGNILLQAAAGRIKTSFQSYLPLFLIAGCAYLVAVGVLQLLSPRLTRPAVDDVR